MDRLHRLTISAQGAGQRLDRYLGGVITEVSREKIKRAILEGHCLVNGLPVIVPSLHLAAGQMVELRLSPPSAAVIPEEGDIAPLWQDAHMLVLNKPAGLTVHPCPSCPEGTLVQRLVAHFPQLLHQDGPRPGIVHRLDKDTSGLLVVALTESARLSLSVHFAARDVSKEYVALVRGLPPAEGNICEPVGRHPFTKVKMAIVPENRGGRPAHSQWQTLHADPEGRFTLVRIRIHTGRTHQIRVHMAHAGFPLWGDALYGPKDDSDPAPRQMLHAWRLSLPHPDSGERLTFTCPPPLDMLETALTLSRHTRRVVITGLPGSGKSALLRCLEALGAPTWSADAEVTRLYAPGGDGQGFLLGRFGERFVPQSSAPVDRVALRIAMKKDPCLRQEVEAVVHGMVRHSLEVFWQGRAREGHTLAVAEVPLYLETGWADRRPAASPLLVGVACPKTDRYRRLIQGRGWTREQCRAVDAWQWPEKRKMDACHRVVDNSDAQEHLEVAAQELLEAVGTEEETRTQALVKRLEALWRG